MLVPTCDELAGRCLVGTPLDSVHLAVGHQLHSDVSVPCLLLQKLQQQVEGQVSMCEQHGSGGGAIPPGRCWCGRFLIEVDV